MAGAPDPGDLHSRSGLGDSHAMAQGAFHHAVGASIHPPTANRRGPRGRPPTWLAARQLTEAGPAGMSSQELGLSAVTKNWRDRAACRNEEPELFFPVGTTGPALAQIEEAKAVCQSCTVLVDCLQWVTSNEPPGHEAGVCAGLSETERRALKRRAARARQQNLSSTDLRP